MTIDFEYLKKAISVLKSYLQSDRLFWPNLGSIYDGKRQHYALTVGGILLSQKKIEAQLSNKTSLSEYSTLRDMLEAIISEWRTAWTRKAELELISRLRQWGNYIDELIQDPDSHIPFYRNEVRIRSILNLLSNVVEMKEENKEQLDYFDSELRERFIPGNFIWEEDLIDAFPPEDFWFLWGMVGS